MKFFIITLFLLVACVHSVQADPQSDFLDNKKKADQGDAEAQYNVGACYTNGLGVLKDHDKALVCMRVKLVL